MRLNVHAENIAGVHLPIFSIRGEDEQNDDNALLGLAGGGQAIVQAREKFTQFLKVLVVIATLQTQFVVLDAALKTTNRRVNALEFILLPRIKDIIGYIEKELDEESREDFYRLKKVTDNKKTKKAEAENAISKEEESKDAADMDVIPATHYGDSDEDDEVFV